MVGSPTMRGKGKHEHFCFAGQSAACQGYFPNGVLPCVCGAEGDAVTALSQVAVPSPLGGNPREEPGDALSQSMAAPSALPIKPEITVLSSDEKPKRPDAQVPLGPVRVCPSPRTAPPGRASCLADRETARSGILFA